MKPAGATLIDRFAVFGMRSPENLFSFEPRFRIKLILLVCKKPRWFRRLDGKEDRILINVWLLNFTGKWRYININKYPFPACAYSIR